MSRTIHSRRLRVAYNWLTAFGFDPVRFSRAVRFLSVVLKEWNTLRGQSERAGNHFQLSFTNPCLDDRGMPSGIISPHYFYQDLLVARKIFQRKPVKHVDVGSRLDGFVAHVASFMPIEVLDIRPQNARIPEITFRKCDVMNPSIQFEDYCDSLSCLHALEHFGLGRYGDTIDIFGHMRGMENLHRILRAGGILYLSVPIGHDAIEFNGDRVISIRTVLEMAHNFRLVGFSFVDDDNILHENIELDSDSIANNCGCEYGCGIFEFKKPEEPI